MNRRRFPWLPVSALNDRKVGDSREICVRASGLTFSIHRSADVHAAQTKQTGRSEVSRALTRPRRTTRTRTGCLVGLGIFAALLLFMGWFVL